jgi:hypothetical protein
MHSVADVKSTPSLADADAQYRTNVLRQRYTGVLATATGTSDGELYAYFATNTYDTQIVMHKYASFFNSNHANLCAQVIINM